MVGIEHRVLRGDGNAEHIIMKTLSLSPSSLRLSSSLADNVETFIEKAPVSCHDLNVIFICKKNIYSFISTLFLLRQKIFCDRKCSSKIMSFPELLIFENTLEMEVFQ